MLTTQSIIEDNVPGERQPFALKDQNIVASPSRTSSDVSKTNATMLPSGQATIENSKESTKDCICDSNEAEQKKQFDYVCLTRFAETIDDEDLDDGCQEWSINDFEYIRTLGSGGTATVFRAREKQSGYHVALKVQNNGDDAVCEIDVHEPLDHPSIVKMIDYFFSDESFGPSDNMTDPQPEASGEEDETKQKRRYLVMILELCDGGSLFDIVRDAQHGYLPEKRAKAYFRNALDAMGYFHSKDFIHCDCKSLNFLLQAKDDRLKLADFGMSVPNDCREVIGGSPVYMSPEHLMAWRHLTDDFDHRSDIYSLGVVLFEMLVGYLPYEVLNNDDAEDDENSLIASLEQLGIDDNDDEFRPPILDLRKLDDQTADEPFYIPPPVFPDFVSGEAQDLISRLMEPCLEDRISLSEAKGHPWFQDT